MNRPATSCIGPKRWLSNAAGFSGIRSNRATPPIGNKVMSGVLIPYPFAAIACPNSWSTTQTNKSSTKIAALVEPIAIQAINKRKVM